MPAKCKSKASSSPQLPMVTAARGHSCPRLQLPVVTATPGYTCTVREDASPSRLSKCFVSLVNDQILTQLPTVTDSSIFKRKGVYYARASLKLGSLASSLRWGPCYDPTTPHPFHPGLCDATKIMVSSICDELCYPGPSGQAPNPTSKKLLGYSSLNQSS